MAPTNAETQGARLAALAVAQAEEFRAVPHVQQPLSCCSNVGLCSADHPCPIAYLPSIHAFASLPLALNERSSLHSPLRFPYNRSFWGCTRDPWWCVLKALTMLPVYGLSSLSFLLLFLVIDRSDE